MTNLVAFCYVKTGWINEEKAIDVVYLVFSRAFDNVFHSILVG